MVITLREFRCKTKTKKTPADGISPLDFRSALRERDFVSKLPSLVLLIPPPSCVRLYHRQAKTPVRSEPEKPSFTCSFSRHAKAQTCLALVIWLNENVHKFPSLTAKIQTKTHNFPAGIANFPAFSLFFPKNRVYLQHEIRKNNISIQELFQGLNER